MLHFLKAITKLNVQIQIQCVPGTLFGNFLYQDIQKQKGIVKKTFKKDMFINPSERSLSWPTTCLVEAKGSIPINGISILLKLITFI